MDITGFYVALRRMIVVFDKTVFCRWNVHRVYMLSWVYLIAVYGIGTVSFHPTFNVSQNPFVNYYKDEWRGHYLYESLPLPLIAYFTGLSSSYAAFCAFCLFLLLCGNAFLVWRIFRQHGPEVARVSILLFALGPISLVLLMFVGEYDVITYLLQCLLFVCNSMLGIVLLGLAGGLQHFPVMLLSGLSLLCFRSLIQYGSLRLPEKILYALAAYGGSILTRIYQQHYKLGIQTGRLSYVLRMPKTELIRNILANWLACLFSLYGVFWMLVLLLAWMLFRSHRRAFWAFVISNGVFLIVSQFVTDTTRVFVLCSWPTLLSASIWLFAQTKDAPESESWQLRHFFSGIVIAGLLIPRMIVWQGAVYSSFLENLFHIGRHLFQGLMQRAS